MSLLPKIFFTNVPSSTLTSSGDSTHQDYGIDKNNQSPYSSSDPLPNHKTNKSHSNDTSETCDHMNVNFLYHHQDRSAFPSVSKEKCDYMNVNYLCHQKEILSFTYILNVLASHHFLSTHNQSLGTIPIINKPGGCNALTSKYFNLLYTEPKHMIALNFLLQLNMTWLVIPNCRAFCTVSAVLEDVYRLQVNI